MGAPLGGFCVNSSANVVFDSKDELNHTIEKDARVDNPNAKDNAELIREFIKTGESGDEQFDIRVKATCKGLKRAIEWVQQIQEQK